MIQSQSVSNFNEKLQKKRNWLFLDTGKITRKENIRNLDKIECISKKLETYNKFFNYYFEEALGGERSSDLGKILKNFDLEYKEIASNEIKFNLENLKEFDEIKSGVNENINCVKKVSRIHLRKPYCRYHMMWLYNQEKLFKNKSLKNFSQNYDGKNKINLKINTMKKIEKFCSWAEKNFGEKVVTFDDSIKSIHLILPFISVLTEFRESEINCIDSLKHSQVETQVKKLIKMNRKSIAETICVKYHKKKDTQKRDSEKKSSDLNETNKKNENLINKIKNAPGAKLFIDYVRKKNGKSPFGI